MDLSAFRIESNLRINVFGLKFIQGSLIHSEGINNKLKFLARSYFKMMGPKELLRHDAQIITAKLIS